MAFNKNAYETTRRSENGLTSSVTPSSTTVIKYEKSSCLFCSEWFDSKTFTEHLIHCGQVCEACPNDCSAYIPRVRMRAHLRECPRSTINASKNNCNGIDQQSWQHKLQILEQDLDTLRTVLNEEIRQRLHLITDVGHLRKQNQVTDDWTRYTEGVLKDLEKLLHEEKSERCLEMQKYQQDLSYYNDVIQSLKTEIDSCMEELRTNVIETSYELTRHQNLLNENILRLEENLLEQEKKNSDNFKRMETFLDDVAGDLKTKLATNSELCNKQAILDYEVKSMKNIVCETEERYDKVETILLEIDKRLHHTIQALSDLENHLATEQRLTSIQNTNGHIIWRIKDYPKRLEEAKRYDAILHSAMFSNKQFGYALRLDVYLNGKGNWKGRNIIACLNVINGEYDPLLAWPCRLQADIIIRDQCSNPEDVQDYIKTVHVCKKSNEYFQSNQFFHIPHKIVNSRNYLRNNCLFLEVKVHKQK